MELDLTDVTFKQIREKKANNDFGVTLNSFLKEILACHVVPFTEESLNSEIIQKVLNNSLDREKTVKKVEEIL